MKNFSLFKNLLLKFIFFCFVFTAYAQKEKTEDRIDSVMKQYKMAGLSVAVVKKREIIYVHSFGLKSIETKTPLSNDDIFRIASISKSFSATSIMQLVEAKKLSLNDDVSNLIGFKVRNPKFPEKVITLKMLMSHTSSLNIVKAILHWMLLILVKIRTRQNAITIMRRAKVINIVI